VGPLRTNDIPDSIVPSVRQLDEAGRLARYDEPDKGIEVLDELLKTSPEFLPALIIRAGLHESLASFPEAIADYEEAIRVEPNSYGAHNGLGWLLIWCPDASIRNGTKALEHAKRAMAIRQFQTAISLSLLAAAQAESGDTKQAAETQRLALAAPGNDLKGRDRLQAYEAGKTYPHPIELFRGPVTFDK
jgi:tetratricopeptide (TPR) repeat protein